MTLAMINIIKADAFRLRKSKVILGIIIGLLMVLMLGNFMALNGDGKMTFMSDTLNLNEVTYSLQGSKIMPELLKGSNILLFFLIPIVLNIFISEFKFSTIKNTVSYKYKRTQIYFSKFILCSILCFLLILSYVGIGLILNLAFNKMQGTIEIQDFILTIKIILTQMPIYIGIVALMLLIGILFQSSTAVILITILYPFLITIVAYALKIKDISSYEPVTCLDKAAYFMSLTNREIIQLVVIGVIMIAFSLLFGLLIYNRRDFK